jgi:hypothetical protein
MAELITCSDYPTTSVTTEPPATGDPGLGSTWRTLALGPFLSIFTITFNPELERVNLALFRSIANTFGTKTFNDPDLGGIAAVVV